MERMEQILNESQIQGEKEEDYKNALENLTRPNEDPTDVSRSKLAAAELPIFLAAQDITPTGATGSGGPPTGTAQELKVASGGENAAFPGIPEGAVMDDGTKPDRGKAKKRGRPIEIPVTAKRAAAEVRAGGGTWRDVAKVLYQVPYPTDSQVKNAPNVLKHFRRTAIASP